jgi:hypothetical protein
VVLVVVVIVVLGIVVSKGKNTDLETHQFKNFAVR